MKIDNSNAPKKVQGEETVIGQVYVFDGTNEAYFRCAGGLVNLVNGNYQNLDTVVSGCRWLHCPNAELVL